MIPFLQLEQGIRTLAHNWRNTLNGIHLHVMAAEEADSEVSRKHDFDEIRRLISEATSGMIAVSRKLSRPEILQIPYPTGDFTADLQEHFDKPGKISSGRLFWTTGLRKGRAMVDYDQFAMALEELLSNTLRRMPEPDRLDISVTENAELLVFSWMEISNSKLLPESWGETPFLTKERGKLGLGIWFARQVIEGHGGGLDFVYSEKEKTLVTKLRIPLEKL